MAVMFSFGIFSTHIPYLVFFFFYLTYFFFSHKSAEKKEFLENFFFEKEEVFVDAENQIDHNSYYYGKIDPKTDFTILQSLTFYFLQNQTILGPGDRIEIAHFRTQTGQVLNRPPPFYIQ